MWKACSKVEAQKVKQLLYLLPSSWPLVSCSWQTVNPMLYADVIPVAVKFPCLQHLFIKAAHNVPQPKHFLEHVIF